MSAEDLRQLIAWLREHGLQVVGVEDDAHRIRLIVEVEKLP